MADRQDPPTPRAISRRQSLRLGAAALAGLPSIQRARFRLFPESAREYSARAIRLVEETVVVDLLNQFRFADYAETPPRSERWLRSPGAFTAADFETYRTSGIRVFGLGHGSNDYESAVRYHADWNGFLAAYDQWFLRIDEAADLERARASGRIGIMLTFQGADHFRTVADVDAFHGLGQRVVQLTYNLQNRLGAGFLEQNDGGLTVFGGAVLERMQKVGMAVDLSHCGDRTTQDGLAAAKRPVVFSHASCRALLPGHLRCKTDEAVRGLARTGGVMGIPFIRFMVRLDEPVELEHVLDHVDHVARLVGVEHVGIGSDLDILGNANPLNAPAGQSPMSQPNFDRYRFHVDTEGHLGIRRLDHPKRVYDLTEGLIARKYSDADIRLVLGGNWARVLAAAWSS